MIVQIQKFREAQNMSRAELARRSGVALSFINAIESGEKSPTIRTLDKIAVALGVTASELIKQSSPIAANE